MLARLRTLLKAAQFSESGTQLVMGLLNFTQHVVQPLIDSIFKLHIPYLIEVCPKFDHTVCGTAH